MRISDFIFALEQIQDEHGDLEVETYDYNHVRVLATPPCVDYRAIFDGREEVPRFASSFLGDKLSRVGGKVCRL